MHDLIENIVFDPAFATDWHMTYAERAAMLQILSRCRPEVSVEIGTFRGGSLRPISRFSKLVYTFDIDANQHRNTADFPNVEFVTGDTRESLPPIIAWLNDTGANLNFILVDGSHEEDSVCLDIAHCLTYVPKSSPLVIVMHDSSNPAVRAGILKSPWAACPHVHCLNLDFVPGMLYDRPDIKGEIWGGLALAVLLPEPRVGEIQFTASFEYSRNILLSHSIYDRVPATLSD